MEPCHMSAGGHVAAPPSIGAEPTVISNGSRDAGGPAAAVDPTVATLAAVAHRALPDAQQARKPSAPRPAVGEATLVPAADSTAALETTSAAAAAHKAQIRSAQAQLAARARRKKHRQNLPAAASALPVDVRRARQPVMRRRTRAQKASSVAADQPAGEGTGVTMADSTHAAAPGSGRLPAPEEAAGPADADGACDVQRVAGDSEPGNATIALRRLSLHEQAAAQARCYWLHPPWMADHPPPPHLQVRHTSEARRRPARVPCHLQGWTNCSSDVLGQASPRMGWSSVSSTTASPHTVLMKKLHWLACFRCMMHCVELQVLCRPARALGAGSRSSTGCVAGPRARCKAGCVRTVWLTLRRSSPKSLARSVKSGTTTAHPSALDLPGLNVEFLSIQCMRSAADEAM